MPEYLTGVVADVIVGQAAGAGVGKFADSKIANSPDNKILANTADRAQRIADNPKVGRPEARQRQANEAKTEHETNVAQQQANAGAVGANAAQGGIKIATCSQDKQDC